MSEADETIEGDFPYSKRKFKNGDVCPWDRKQVFWGYRESGEWWMSWDCYWQMAERHKGLVKTKSKAKKGSRGLVNGDKKTKKPHPHKEQKKLLIQFWNHFLPKGEKWENNSTKANALSHAKEHSKEFKIKLLIEYSNIVIRYNHQTSVKHRRNQFNKKRETLSNPNSNMNKLCFACGERSNVPHHIIQLQHGGLNSKKNITPLCHSCHAEIHPWLRRKS